MYMYMWWPVPRRCSAYNTVTETAPCQYRGCVHSDGAQVDFNCKLVYCYWPLGDWQSGKI